MTKDELMRAAERNAELKAGADTDGMRVDDILKRVDSQLVRNHFAEIFYETMRRRGSKA